MKTLIFSGSPRKAGETAALIEAVKERLQGEITEVFAYDRSIRPCTDCRYCREHPGCAIADGWQELQAQIRQADNILIASPVWFGTLPGELLSMLSRLQSGFCAEAFRGAPKAGAPKRGAILLTAGGTGGIDGAIHTAKILLRQMNAKEIFDPVCSLQTDRLPAGQDQNALAAAERTAEFFNRAGRLSKKSADLVETVSSAYIGTFE